MPSLGGILYVVLLFINSMAVLSEDRFLARIGWSTVPTPTNPTVGFQQPYDQYGGGAGGVQDIGVKGRLINLIGAVRTLMRIPLIAFNLVVIGYELILG